MFQVQCKQEASQVSARSTSSMAARLRDSVEGGQAADDPEDDGPPAASGAGAAPAAWGAGAVELNK